MFLIAFPLLLIPFALYNMIVFLLNMPFTDTVFAIPLGAQRTMPVTTGDLIVVVAILMLYLEVLKATRLGGKPVMDHVLSLIVLAAIVSELVLVPRAATPTLLLLGVVGFVDLIIGLSVPIRRQQKIRLEGTDEAPV